MGDTLCLEGGGGVRVHGLGLSTEFYSAAVCFKRAVKLSAQRRPGSPPQSSQAI